MTKTWPKPTTPIKTDQTGQELFNKLQKPSTGSKPSTWTNGLFFDQWDGS